FLRGIAVSPQVAPLVRVAFALFAFAAFVLVHVADYSGAGLVTCFAAAAFMLGFAYRDGPLDDIIATAALLLLAVLATWHLPFLANEDVFMAALRLPVRFAEFTAACVAAAVLLGGGGFAAQMSAARSGRWAAMSVVAGALILVIAYWRVHEVGIDLGWSTLALVLAGLDLAVA